MIGMGGGIRPPPMVSLVLALTLKLKALTRLSKGFIRIPNGQSIPCTMTNEKLPLASYQYYRLETGQGEHWNLGILKGDSGGDIREYWGLYPQYSVIGPP